jgi:hypothetical protein
MKGVKKMTDKDPVDQLSIPPCCPKLAPNTVCDILDYQYRQLYHPRIGDRVVTVEVIIHVRFQRCPGPLALGDLVYSTTLLPGEKVRLFTTDRRSRFSFDSASKVSYRNEQTSEEHYAMSAWGDFMSDLTVRDSARSTNTSKGHFDTHGETSGVLSTIFGSPSIDVSGNYNASSTSDFLHELSQHASSSYHRAEMGSRAASSLSIGEVQTRTHTEGESEDHFESSSREFSNPNRCHAITFFFYRINKTQTVKFTLEAIERRVVDPAADTKVTNNAFASRGDVSTIPNAVLATDKQRLDIEAIGRTSIANEQQATLAGNTRLQTLNPALLQLGTVGSFAPLEPLSDPVRKEALQAVDKQLVAVGLLDKVGGVATTETQKEFSFEIKSSLPTPGVLVKGCLDDCDVCEDTLEQDIKLDLERKRLENARLQREIDLMDKDQQHRCCPEGEEEAPRE